MKITIYENFKKRINSTKRPTGGREIDVVLKAPTSIENPTFILEQANSNINYVKWADHYYFIQNKTILSNNLTEIACKQDELAIYKDDILNLTAFVEYSTSNFNPDMLDTRISNTGAVTRATNQASFSNVFISNGRYILSVVGDDGVADNYMITKDQLNSLGHAISTAGESVVEDVGKKFGNLLNCIVGLTWIPFTMGAGVLEEIHLGSFATGVRALRIQNNAIVSQSVNITIPWISSNKGRNAKESMTIYLPGYGTTSLDVSSYIGADSITIDIRADITGTITYALHNPGGTVDYFNANLGAQIPVTQYTQSPVGMLMSPLQKVTDYFAKAWENSSPLINMILSASATIDGYLVNTGANSSSIGGQGSISLGLSAISNDTIYLTNKSFTYSESQEDMAVLYGRPLMAITSLASLSGYVKCNGASVNIDGLEGDKNTVNAYLNSGFYIE